MWIFADTNTIHSVAEGNINKLGNSAETSEYFVTNGIDNGDLPPIVDNPPRIFHAINKHGLAIFLIVGPHLLPLPLYLTEETKANLFTGLINLSIQTMYVENVMAMCILSLYSVVICAIGWYWPSHRP